MMVLSKLKIWPTVNVSVVAKKTDNLLFLLCCKCITNLLSSSFRILKEEPKPKKMVIVFMNRLTETKNILPLCICVCFF